MTVTVFGYLILINIDFLRFYLSVFSIVLVSIDNIYQTLKTVFDILLPNTSNFVKNTPLRVIFSTLFSVTVWKCGQTRSLVFDILLQVLKKNHWNYSITCKLLNSLTAKTKNSNIKRILNSYAWYTVKAHLTPVLLKSCID